MAKKTTKTAQRAKRPEGTEGLASEATGVALVDTKQTAMSNQGLPEGYAVAKLLTIPLLKFGPNATIYVRIDSNIFKSKKLTNAKGAEAKKEPPFLCEVVRVGDPNNVKMHLITPAVLKSELERNYDVDSGDDGVSGDYKKPGFIAGYVGKAFAIKSFAPLKAEVDETTGEVLKEGKSYRTFAIAELKKGATA